MEKVAVLAKIELLVGHDPIVPQRVWGGNQG